MAMGKKDFIALADVIREHNSKRGEYGDGFSLEQVATLADWCASQNSAFNRKRWLGYIADENGPNGQTNIPGERV